jgi:hypothetical protein
LPAPLAYQQAFVHAERLRFQKPFDKSPFATDSRTRNVAFEPGGILVSNGRKKSATDVPSAARLTARIPLPVHEACVRASAHHGLVVLPARR